MAASSRLVSKLAVVTGGGSGIGRAVCQRFASEGASVVVADIDEGSASRTVAALPRGHRAQEHMAAAVDVSSRHSVDRLLTSIQHQYFQPPSLCVSAAGITQDEFLLKMDEEDFDRVIEVNLKGTFLVTQVFSRAMVSSGFPKGSIITIGSIVGKMGNIGQVNYSASKAGVVGLTRTAAKELSKFGIRCNCVLPGFIATPMTDKIPEKVLSKVLSLVPMGRIGEPAEVADVCAFLASDESRYITGVSIEVTGTKRTQNTTDTRNMQIRVLKSYITQYTLCLHSLNSVNSYTYWVFFLLNMSVLTCMHRVHVIITRTVAINAPYQG
ncbi:(3R)-3-hydroxyacyl-CoA dehydrogenase isoform X1 [Scleropages formosus]|uniref:(3R)-3-hydroxyacyl-CoA dehydrogenase isoform X1 n=2 Tax=Scleropages formosus TaxID=113540 RepID=UPI0010FAA04E|nr:estradiol 17-beta-dehydrogenase 8 isoform X1 [Scleropages formosus]